MIAVIVLFMSVAGMYYCYQMGKIRGFIEGIEHQMNIEKQTKENDE